MSKLRVRKRDGKMYRPDKEDFAKLWEDLEDGDYEIYVRKATRGNTRYRFYFDAVCWCILCQAGDYFMVAGKKPSGVEDIHLVLKLKYNPMEILDLETGEVLRVPFTTTVMNDTEFISRYEEQIIADFSGPPFLVEFPTFEKWRELRSEGQWHEWKDKVYGPR